MSLKLITALVFLMLCAGFHPAEASTPEPPAKLSTYVVDLAQVVKADEAVKLNANLKALEEKTGAQVVILTVQSLDGENIEAFSLKTAEKWKLGQKGKDNGVLLTVAVKDKKYRFEVGYGLESVLPDSLMGSIGRQTLAPAFRRGEYGTGLLKASEAIAAGIVASRGNNLDRPTQKKTNWGLLLVPIGLLGIFLAIFSGGWPFRIFDFFCESRRRKLQHQATLNSKQPTTLNGNSPSINREKVQKKRPQQKQEDSSSDSSDIITGIAAAAALSSLNDSDDSSSSSSSSSSFSGGGGGDFGGGGDSGSWD
jgi:uncharacterized protein